MITLDQDLCFERTLSDCAIAEAKSLRVRTDLMLALQNSIEQRGWSPDQAAKLLKQTLPRMQNLMNGEISRFSTEQLIQLLSLVGLEVRVSVLDLLPKA